MSAPRRALLIAYHYPPVQASSGVQRTLAFSRYLPELGWHPAVLTVTRNAFVRHRAENERLIPHGVQVLRAPALDAARHLSIGGRYPRVLGLPDRWVSWLPGAVARGLAWIRRCKPQIVFSTYPIATAHLIGWWLHRLTGLPWVADFRDPMAQEDYPEDPRQWASFKAVEERAVRDAARMLFVTEGAAQMYRQRYPQAAERVAIVENGYDEATFAGSDAGVAERREGPLTLLHSGILYLSERDPNAFFDALAQLKREGAASAATLRIVLRASGHVEHYRALLEQRGIADLVALEPPVDYRAAVAEMTRADGLLVFQASNCNAQIPAKVYEYLRAGRPILAFTDPAGDTARLLARFGVDALARLDSSAEIAELLRRALRRIPRGDWPLADPRMVAACTRRERSRELAAIFDDVAGNS